MELTADLPWHSSLYLLLLLLLPLPILLLTKRLLSSSLHLPPSPPKLPIFGNLHQLGTHPHRSLYALSLRYGPVMLLHLGNKPTLIVSSADAAREVMKTHDLVFSNRPDTSVARRLLYDFKDLAQAPYGEYWRQMRSVCVLRLLSAKRVSEFGAAREEEAKLLVEKVEGRAKSGTPVDLTELFAGLTNDMVCRVAFGKKYNEGEGGKRFHKIFEEFGALLGAFNIADFIPWLGWINKYNGLDSRVEKNFKEFDTFIEQIVNDHLANQETKMESQMDFVDVLLEIQKSKEGQYLGRDNLKAMILDMFAAGTDTVYTALEWTMTEIIKNPQVMKKAQAEIRTAVGSKPNVTTEDLDKMLYFKAVMKEAFRLHPPFPLLVPRESSQDVEIQGYDVLAKTRVMINFWAITRDPELWPEPEKFRPERFLERDMDYRGIDFEFIPFGAGRRGCPGITFAIVMMEIILATLLHKFNWSLPDGMKPQDLDVTEAPGLSVHRTLPLMAIATPHSGGVI